MKQRSDGVRQSSVRWALTGLSLTMLMPSLATSTANFALPSLARMFAVSFQAAQWIVLGYLLTVTALVVVAGRIGDIVGRRRLLVAGTSVFAGGSLLCGFAPGFEMLVAARVVQGSGAAVMMALTMAFVGAVVPAERAGRAMGLLGTMSAVGTTLGPVLGGVLIAWAGSATIFVINVPLAIGAVALIVRTLPQDTPRLKATSLSLDLAGMALLTVSLTCFALAMTLGGGQFGLTNITILIAAIAIGIGFVAIEVRAPSPLIRLEVFRNQALIAGLSTNTIVSTVMMSTLIVGPFYLARVVGLDTASAGLALAVGPIVAAVAGVPAGRLVDRFGTQRATVAGLTGIVVAAAALSMVPIESGIAGYLVPIVVMTAGYGLFQAANNTAVMGGISPAERGVVSGMLNLSRNLGLVAGASTMGAVFVWGSGSTDIVSAEPFAVLAGAHATFAASAAGVMVSLILTFRATNSNRQLGAMKEPS